MTQETSKELQSAIGYSFSRGLDLPFEQAVERAREMLKAEGFGVISEINLKEKLKEKLGVNFRITSFWVRVIPRSFIKPYS